MTFGLRQPQTSMCSLVKGLSPLSVVVAGISFHNVRLRVFRSGCCHHHPPPPILPGKGLDPPCSPPFCGVRLQPVVVCSCSMVTQALWPHPGCSTIVHEAVPELWSWASPTGAALHSPPFLSSGSWIHCQTFTGHLGAPKRWALAPDSLHRGT